MKELGDGVAVVDSREEGVVVASAVGDGRICVLTNVGSASVTQHALHVLFAQIQSLSQSSSLLHVSPRQCPSQVHTAWIALVDWGLDVVRDRDVKTDVTMSEDIEERTGQE